MRCASSARSFSRLPLVWCALWLLGCKAGDHGPGLDVDRVMSHVRALTEIGPRPRDSDGSRSAAGYIEDELARNHVAVERSPVGPIDLPSITLFGRVLRLAHTVVTTDPNLLVRFGPPGPALLLMAHYDTVPGSPGASDNAASVALLLELARVLAMIPPEQSIMLAFTANEEIGLVGAEQLAIREGAGISFAIALDLVGGDGSLVINGASKQIGVAELTWLAGAADRAGIVLDAPPVHRVISRELPALERSDHGPFTRRGIRAVHLYNRGNDGEWIDVAYHSARDTASRIHLPSLDDVGRLLVALSVMPPPSPAGNGYWLPVAINTVVPRWSLLACEGVLLALVVIVLGLSREGLVTLLTRERRRGPLPARGPGLLVGIACYLLAFAIACVAERVLARGEAAPWFADPARAVLGDVLVLAGLLGLATRVIGRIKPWSGIERYRVLAVITCALIGTVLLAIGAAELAWLWLVPAAVIALAPPAVAIVASVLPAACVLYPAQLREAAWNGALPFSLPLTLWIAMLGAPTFATLAWWMRGRRTCGPLGTFVLGLGCGLAVLIGLMR